MGGEFPISHFPFPTLRVPPVNYYAGVGLTTLLVLYACTCTRCRMGKF